MKAVQVTITQAKERERSNWSMYHQLQAAVVSLLHLSYALTMLVRVCAHNVEKKNERDEATRRAIKDRGTSMKERERETYSSVRVSKMLIFYLQQSK